MTIATEWPAEIYGQRTNGRVLTLNDVDMVPKTFFLTFRLATELAAQPVRISTSDL
ncbi:hypothetical protein OU994_20955 [Pseudoduganella sp. SL102]|uniref:hypothetical protein n=1 Tax=Pseudoduganella sp. SL102 TaxID=2995154 RepID=UPI00248D2701|nr:hypothetical protein [Pseudoduganella sp. SL102]WBS00769.1 hypothetical protein OU994_20955 [Pseudoduganella sp. SL102]